MPIYEYECEACKQRHEILQKISDPPAEECPGCHANQLKRVISASAFHLKGSGWYVTDFRDKDKKSKASSEGTTTTDTTTSKPSDSSSTTTKKDD